MFLLQLLLLSSAAGSPDRAFTELLESLSPEYDSDQEIQGAEDLFRSALAEGVPYLEQVELLVEEVDLGDAAVARLGSPLSTPPASLPDEIDTRARGVMHLPEWQGATCGSCGWIAGVQTLEARVALVSENYVPYSIQNFMNCLKEVCQSTQPYRVQHITRSHPGYIIPEAEMPYTRMECLKTSSCICGANKLNYTRVLDHQFAFIGPTVKAETEQGVVEGLQSGPLTTCFAKAKPGESTERCKAGCGHSNSIIGYTRDKLVLQESYGKRWGLENDGSWNTTRGGACAQAVINKAYYPLIFYDYDRANAFFTETAVNESDLSFVNMTNWVITSNDTKNIGVGKNKCAYLGSACKGVVILSSGAVELIADFGAGAQGTEKAFRKTQMVVYLKHENTGKYMGVSHNKGLKLVTQAHAAPFFTSHARFISFSFPDYHIVEKKLEKIAGGLRDIDLLKSWTLKDCNLHSARSGLSLDVVVDQYNKNTIGGTAFNASSTSQRFDVGISGEWQLKSNLLGLPLKRWKNKKHLRYAFESNTKKYLTTFFRWNARQMMTWRGQPIDHSTMKFADSYFDVLETDKAIVPTDCKVSKLISLGGADYLTVKNGKVVMGDVSDGGWSFEYADL